MACAFFGFGVAVADCQFDVKVVAPPFKPLKHVPVQRAQRRDVEDFYSRRFGCLKKHTQNGQEGGFGFARGGGRDKKDVFAFENCGMVFS